MNLAHSMSQLHGTTLHQGTLSGDYTVTFTPDFSSTIVQVAIGPVPTKAFICKSCGLITLVGDIDYLRQKLAED